MRTCFIILFLLSYICSATKKKDLQIITEFKPEDCSETAANGDIVAVHYTGRLQNGQVFDSSIAAEREPIKFQLGMGKVIPGWEKGILGMCIGEKRKLIIPPNMAYGANGVKGVIPGHSTLTFDTELIELEKRPVMARSSIQNILAFAIWPAIIIGVLYLLYKRIAAADETIKANKKSRKKKH